MTQHSSYNKKHPASHKSYSQKKRDKYDYRREYFRHNPGIFGCIWSCAYCHRPLVGKQNVQVDHIMPLNNVLGRNSRFNLVAACERCNQRKSDNVDGRVAIGYLSKLIEVIIFSIQKVIVIALVAVWVFIQKIFELLWRCLSTPFRKGSTAVKIVIVAIVVAFVIYLI